METEPSAAQPLPAPTTAPRSPGSFRKYTVRALLSLALVLAVAATFWVIPALQRRAAVMAIASKAHVEYAPRRVPNWLIDGLDAYGMGDYMLTDIKSITFLRGGSYRGSLTGTAQLISLDLSTLVTDTDLAHLAAISELESLDLCGTQATDAGMVHLRDLRLLRNLNLAETQITDAGLENLQGLPSIEQLNLSNTRVSDAGMAQVARLGPKWLWLANTTVGDRGLVEIGKITHLEMIRLYDTNVTDAGVQHLKSLANPRFIGISGAGFTGSGFVELRSTFPSCRVSSWQ